MKTPRRRTLLAWVGVMGLMIAQVSATAVSMTLAPFPANLGAGADPKVIPVGELPVWSNHGYGIANVVTASVPMHFGAMEWKHGQELNLNLASAFGIELECNDITDIPNEPITLHVKDWPRPAYSPYQKDQVLRATLVLLIRMYGTIPELPLKVTVKADNEVDHAALSKFSGEYVIDPETDKLLKGRLEGVTWKRAENGLFRIEFPGITAVKKESERAPLLVWVPVYQGGGESDGEYIAFAPIWVGHAYDIRNYVWSVFPRAINAFSEKKGENANPVHAKVGDLSEEQVQAAGLWAISLTEASNRAEEMRERKYAKNRFDFKTGKLVEGSIPGWTIEPIKSGGWKMVSLTKPPEEKPE